MRPSAKQGIEDVYVNVPLHKVIWKSNLVTGHVVVGLRPSLPVKGVSLLLGNDLAGGKVESNIHMISKPSTSDILPEVDTELFPSCAVTRAMAKQALEFDSSSNTIDNLDDINLSETFIGHLDDLSENAPRPQEGLSSESLIGNSDLSLSKNQTDLTDQSKNAPEPIHGRKPYEGQSSESPNIPTDLSLSRDQLISEQESDPDIKQLICKALSNDELEQVPVGYYFNDGLLMRKWRPLDVPANEDWAIRNQIVIPKSYRSAILDLAHKSPMGGHLGINKTWDKITKHFFWPGLRKDISEYCKTCHTYQIVGKPNVAKTVAPLHPIPAFESPFSRVIVDCVGPLPKSKSGNQYLLTIMCAATRFPEAIPLRDIKAPTISKALIKFFTLVGLPNELQSDQGSNFMSNLYQQIIYELGIRQIKSSAYHPKSQGALKRFQH